MTTLPSQIPPQLAIDRLGKAGDRIKTSASRNAARDNALQLNGPIVDTRNYHEVGRKTSWYVLAHPELDSS